jgi:pyrimidine deaminase RibD-like protein
MTREAVVTYSNEGSTQDCAYKMIYRGHGRTLVAIENPGYLVNRQGMKKWHTNDIYRDTEMLLNKTVFHG